MKQFIKLFIPPIFLNFLTKFKNNKYGWKGDYKTWEEAKVDSTGYDSDKILKTVRKSLLKVKNGEAVYERDSVIFDEIQYSWPLLAGLMLAASKGEGLHVVDFGGSLGSSYYQNKKFLDKLDDVSWSIVEQKHFVDIGKKEFEDDRLKFFYDIEECLKREPPNVLLLSCVLQYIDKPYELLEKLLKFDFKYVIIDLTAVALDKEILTIQKVNPKIYNAAYPSWMLQMEKLHSSFEKFNYILLEDFDALNGYQVKSNDKIIGKYIGEIRMKND